MSSWSLTALVRRYNTNGWSDARIARRLGCSTTQVWRLRGRMGLPAIPGRGDRKGAYRKQARTMSVRSLAETRTDRSRIDAAKMGWPVGVTREAARCLETVYQYGPMTTGQLAGMIGVRPGGGNLGVILRRLVAEGLLARTGQPRKSRRRDSRRVNLLCRPYQYALTEDARTVREATDRRRKGVPA